MRIVQLTPDKCFAALAGTRLMRLGCAHQNQPYVVPVYVVYSQTSSGVNYLYGFTTPGQKVDWMRANPNVCLEWDDIKSFDEWTSIIAFGQYEELPNTKGGVATARLPIRASPPPSQSVDEQERNHAHALLENCALWWQPGYAAFLARERHDSTETYEIVYYRIRIERISGHHAAPKNNRET
jgi:nitroimidazol reductase NimA-like FMN-containing flavoprotein (pyridoxamine 5'-phosphate oxidase superfamily)